MAFRSIGTRYDTGGTTTTAHVISAPASIAKNDRLVLCLSTDSSTDRFFDDTNIPSGWFRIAYYYTTFNDGQALTFYEKIATSSEPSTYTFTSQSSCNAGGRILAFSGRGTAPSIISRRTSGGADLNTPVTLTSKSGYANRGDDLLFFGVLDTVSGGGDTWTFNTISGMTERAEDCPANFSKYIGYIATQDDIGISGETGTKTVTATRTGGTALTDWLAFTLAIPQEDTNPKPGTVIQGAATDGTNVNITASTMTLTSPLRGNTSLIAVCGAATAGSPSITDNLSSDDWVLLSDEGTAAVYFNSRPRPGITTVTIGTSASTRLTGYVIEVFGLKANGIINIGADTVQTTTAWASTSTTALAANSFCLGSVYSYSTVDDVLTYNAAWKPVPLNGGGIGASIFNGSLLNNNEGDVYGVFQRISSAGNTESISGTWAASYGTHSRVIAFELVDTPPNYTVSTSDGINPSGAGTLTLPYGTVNGDTLVLFIADDFNSSVELTLNGTAITSLGWSRLGDSQLFQGVTDYQTFDVYTKVANNEPASWTTVAGSDVAAITLYRVFNTYGVHAYNISTVASGTWVAPNFRVTHPGINVEQDNILLLWGGASDYGGNASLPSISAPSGWELDSSLICGHSYGSAGDGCGVLATASKLLTTEHGIGFISAPAVAPGTSGVATSSMVVALRIKPTAIKFNGGGNPLNFSGPALPNSDWSVGIWSRLYLSPTTYETVFHIGSDGATNPGISYFMNSGGTGEWYCDYKLTSGSAATFQETTNAVYDGREVLTIIQRRGSNVEFHAVKKGDTQSAYNQAFAVGTGTTVSASTWYIGHSPYSDLSSQALGEFFFLTGDSLSVAEITTLASGKKITSIRNPLIYFPMNSGNSLEINKGSGGKLYNPGLINLNGTTKVLPFFDTTDSYTTTGTGPRIYTALGSGPFGAGTVGTRIIGSATNANSISSSGTFTTTGSATGTLKISGTSPGTAHSFTGTATGSIKATITSSQTIPITGTATGSLLIAIAITSSGQVDLTGSAAAILKISGISSGTIVPTAASTGTLKIVGTSSGTYTPGGTAVGTIATAARLVTSDVSIPISGSSTAGLKASIISSGTIDVPVPFTQIGLIVGITSPSKTIGVGTLSAAGSIPATITSTGTISVTGSATIGESVTITSDEKIVTITGSALAELKIGVTSPSNTITFIGSSAGTLKVSITSSQTIPLTGYAAAQPFIPSLRHYIVASHDVEYISASRTREFEPASNEGNFISGNRSKRFTSPDRSHRYNTPSRIGT